MKIIIVSDSPITHGQYNSGFGIIETLSTTVQVMFAGDIHEKPHSTRGVRADIVMVPRTLEEMDDIYASVMHFAKLAVAGHGGEVRHY
jgi:hypothetical protein